MSPGGRRRPRAAANQGPVSAAVGFALVAVLAALALSACGSEGPPAGRGGSAAEPEAPEPIPATARLFFPNASGLLEAEEQEMPPATDRETRLEQLVTALLEGPLDERLYRPFPEGTRLGSVFLAVSGLAYVDLVSDEGPVPPRSGSLSEMLSVYSLVDTLLLDQPQVDGVVLLWNGRQPTTFGGHLDTSRPLEVDERLIAR